MFNLIIQLTSFYALSKELKDVKNKIEIIDKRIELWKEYEEVKPYILKCHKLKPKEQQVFKNKYADKFKRFDEIQTIFKKIETNEGKVSPKEWKKKRVSFEKDISLYEWKLKSLKDEIGSAEYVKKILDEERAKIELPQKIKQRDKGCELEKR